MDDKTHAVSMAHGSQETKPILESLQKIISLLDAICARLSQSKN